MFRKHVKKIQKSLHVCVMCKEKGKSFICLGERLKKTELPFDENMGTNEIGIMQERQSKMSLSFRSWLFHVTLKKQIIHT
jgi:hypothetical protein